MLQVFEPKSFPSFPAGLAWPDHARRTASGNGLAAILEDGVNLAIWQRRGSPKIAAADLDDVDDISVALPVTELAAAVPAALDAAGFGACDTALLGRDIVDLATRFASLMAIDRVAIRLEVVETDACRRFHADYVAVRLICSYVGPGTQWLDDRDAVALSDGTDVTELNVRSIATGDVALFKGRDRTGTPIVHRSPPVAATGKRRLVLVIDPARS